MYPLVDPATADPESNAKHQYSSPAPAAVSDGIVFDAVVLLPCVPSSAHVPAVEWNSWAIARMVGVVPLNVIVAVAAPVPVAVPANTAEQRVLVASSSWVPTWTQVALDDEMPLA